jgi:hypothetical protein
LPAAAAVKINRGWATDPEQVGVGWLAARSHLSFLPRGICDLHGSVTRRVEVLPFFFGPVLGKPTQIKTSADNEFTLSENLRLPTPRLPVKAELAGPRHGIVSDAPDRLTWFRLSLCMGPMIWAIEGVVVHFETIPGSVTGEVRPIALVV